MKAKIATILILALIPVILISGCIFIEELNTGLGCETDEGCSLSMCDCNCHVSGQTPEALENKLCGINCLEHYNVTGCECVIQPSGTTFASRGLCVKVIEY